MGDNFFPSRGCVYAIPASGGGGEGFYRLPGVSDLKDPSSPVLLLGADTLDQDVVAPVVTTEDFKVLYVFGSGFGNIRINGQILLGNSDKKSGTVAKLIQWFNEKRVSKSKAPVEFSLGTSAYKIYVQGLALGVSDPEFNIQPFSIIGLVAEPAK